MIVILFSYNYSMAGIELKKFSFSKSLEMSKDMFSIDNKKSSKLKCPFDVKRKFAQIINTSNTLELKCHDDYLGGFFLEGYDKAIAQRDSDAGQSWDVQSVLFKSLDSSLVLWVKTYTTYETSIECSQTNEKDLSACISRSEVKCKELNSFLRWSKEEKVFKPFKYEGEKPVRKIGPGKFYAKFCIKNVI